MMQLIPLLRSLKRTCQLALAKLKVSFPFVSTKKDQTKVAFIIGSGRSGTTILGDMLGLHPEIRYFFEPWHLWYVVNKVTDVLHLFGRDEAHILMGSEFGSAETQHRFNILFLAQSRGKKLCLEKTPHNAMRIDFIRAIAPTAKYVHIVRDGVEVVSSIARLAKKDKYKLTYPRHFHSWWGRDYNKWNALKEEGAAAGYYPQEASDLSGDKEKAAYEWLVSLGEIDRCRTQLGQNLLEVKYTDLVSLPRETLVRICNFLGLSVDDKWLSKAIVMIRTSDSQEQEFLELPGTMCAEFNAYQEHYGFSGRAVVKVDSATGSRQ